MTRHARIAGKAAKARKRAEAHIEVGDWLSAAASLSNAYDHQRLAYELATDQVAEEE
jgi:hypothetical protein